MENTTPIHNVQPTTFDEGWRIVGKKTKVQVAQSSHSVIHNANSFNVLIENEAGPSSHTGGDGNPPPVP